MALWLRSPREECARIATSSRKWTLQMRSMLRSMPRSMLTSPRRRRPATALSPLPHDSHGQAAARDQDTGRRRPHLLLMSENC